MKRRQIVSRINNCKKKTCYGCKFKDSSLTIFDDSGRKCLLIYYNAGGMRLQDVGDLLGISHERVRQIETKALLKLMRSMEFEDEKNEVSLGVLRKRLLEVSRRSRCR